MVLSRTINGEGTELKKAILIAMADEYPFADIRKQIYPKLEKFYSENGFDVFFVSGRTQSRAQRIIRRQIEKLRWNKYAILLRVYDVIALAPYKFIRPKVSMYNQDIRVNVPEDLRHLSLKILESLSFLAKKGYQIIIRTTVSSVIIPQMLAPELGLLINSKYLYAGREIEQADRFRFISGCFTIFNQNSINLLESHRSSLDFSLIDDVCFGKFFLNHGVHPKSISSVNIQTTSEAAQLTVKNLKPHYRCKSGLRSRNDLEVMTQLLRRCGI